jgi:hypothetical protein
MLSSMLERAPRLRALRISLGGERHAPAVKDREKTEGGNVDEEAAAWHQQSNRSA